MQEPLQSFRRHLRLAFIIPILLTTLVGGVFVAQTYYLRDTFRSVEKSYLVEAQSRIIFKLIMDMETGLRGYLLTGEGRFLEPYRAAEPRIGPAISDLLNLVRSNPAQYRAVVRLQTYYDAWHAYSQRMIALRQRSGPVSDFRVNLEGKELMDLLRRDNDEVAQVEQSNIRSRIDSVSRSVRIIFATTIVLSLILGVLLAIFSRNELASAARSYHSALNTAQTRTEEYKVSQRWLEAVLGSIGDGVIVTDNSGVIVFTNPVAKRLLADAQQLFAGRLAKDVIHLVDELSREPLPDPYTEITTSGQASVFTGRILLRREDNKEIPVSQVASILRDEIGTATGVVIVLRDLTQQRMSERALQSSEKLASMGRLAASVAHEIHNPLDAMGNLLYLLEHQAIDDSAKTYVRLAREELERITSISEQMLTFSREARKPVKIHLSEVIENVLALFMPRIRLANVVLVKQYSAHDGQVIALPGEMRQVFSNLIGNALDAMNGTGRLVIRIEDARNWSNPGETGVRVMVCDSGPGIPPEVRNNLMDPFITSKGEKGTGLGLWVCRGIVEKHHGIIRVHSSTMPRHSGTCFSVFLPTGTAEESGNTPNVAQRKVG
ncbi:MAG: CHASE3 domain-containing protein [Terriglobales bacterium]